MRIISIGICILGIFWLDFDVVKDIVIYGGNFCFLNKIDFIFFIKLYKIYFLKL